MSSRRMSVAWQVPLLAIAMLAPGAVAGLWVANAVHYEQTLFFVAGHALLPLAPIVGLVAAVRLSQRLRPYLAVIGAMLGLPLGYLSFAFLFSAYLLLDDCTHSCGLSALVTSTIFQLLFGLLTVETGSLVITRMFLVCLGLGVMEGFAIGYLPSRLPLRRLNPPVHTAS